MPKHLTPAQKAAAKAFVAHVRDCEKQCGLPRREFVKLIGLPETTYRCWFSRKTLPNEETQAKVRDAAFKSYDRASIVKEELFSLLAVTADPSKPTD